MHSLRNFLCFSVMVLFLGTASRAACPYDSHGLNKKEPLNPGCSVVFFGNGSVVSGSTGAGSGDTICSGSLMQTGSCFRVVKCVVSGADWCQRTEIHSNGTIQGSMAVPVECTKGSSKVVDASRKTDLCVKDAPPVSTSGKGPGVK